MKDATLYIKAEKDTILSNKKVYLEDLITMYSTDQALVKELGQKVVMMITQDKREKFVFSILKIIDLIAKDHPGLTIENLGETDFILEYAPPGKKHVVWEWVKTVLVCFTIFIGAAFTIMTFNEDVSVGDVFQKIYRHLMGIEEQGGSVLEIAYAIGLPIGIIVFYNHFSKVKIDSDPTPLQVQLRMYESDVNDTVVENASREGKVRDV